MNTPVIIIGDLHIGARNNSALFLDYMKSYFYNELFPLIKKYNIKHVIQLGDTLDKRKNIDFITSAFLIKEWFSWFDDNNVTLYSLIGNHDTYYKNTNSVSGIKQYENLFKNIKIITEPETIKIGSTNFIIVPWVCPENKDSIKEYLENIIPKKNGEYNIVCGHFELAGFAIHRNFLSKTGTLENDEFNKFDHVFSGHYHSPSKNGIIQYVGTPYWLTWNDYGDKKKIILMDADNPLDTMQNIYTEHSLFHKIVYQSGMSTDINIPSGSYVKLIVNEPDELLDVFVNNITEKYNLSQCQIIDVSEVDTVNNDELDNIELDDPFKIMMNSISGIKDNYVVEELMSIYTEAQAISLTE